MRRTQVWLSVFRNSFIHEVLFELLQPFWCIGMRRVSPWQFLVHILIGFWDFGWFMQRVSPCQSTLTLTSGWCWIGYWTFNILRWWCWSCGSRRAWWRRACRQTRDHDRHVLLRVALYPFTILNEMWFVTTGPLIWISVVLAKLSQRQHCWRVLEELYR